MIVWWTLMLFACFEPTTTGVGGMTGTVHGASGNPISNLTIATVEARAVTDASGHFAVEYQVPATYIDFRQGSSLYQRHYRDADAGKQVAIRLPATRDAILQCTGADPCMALLNWSLTDGLIARTTVRCEPGKSVELTQIPVSTPTANCQQVITEPPAPIQFNDSGDTLTVGEPIYSYSVAITTAKGEPARPCTLTVDGQRIPRDPNGYFATRGSGTVTIEATCGQRTVASQEYKIERDGNLSIQWSPEVPDETGDLQPQHD